MPEQFHFLHPLWFLALIPLAALLWRLAHRERAGSDWQRACASHLLPYLLDKPQQAFSRLPLWLLAAGGVLAVAALADPVWKKQPQPVYRSPDAIVVVLDLSRSMLSGDLTPSRLERARFKVAEILRQRTEGQTGLVVFAGDAFTVSPLTDDARTIGSLLKTLNPDLMPVQGSRADLGMQLAGGLLRQAGLARGDILLIGDGYSDPRALDVAADLRHQGYRLSVLGVGSDRPAPIPDSQGSFVRDSLGRVVMPALDAAKLRSLADAGGGGYSTISVDDADLTHLLPASVSALKPHLTAAEQSTDRWQSQGPWLVLVLLPLAALAFRRGWLLALPLAVMVTLGTLPQPAMAAPGWDDLWQRRDQQADRALHSGDLERARQLAEQPLRRGEAAYRSGDFSAALAAFGASATAQGDYNRGNSLAQLGRYREAIAAYDEALAKNPALADASHNKQALEKLLEQQKQQADRQQTGNQPGGDGKQSQGQAQSGEQNSDAGRQHGGRQVGNQQRSDGRDSQDQAQSGEQNSAAGRQHDGRQAGNQQRGEQQASGEHDETGTRSGRQAPAEPNAAEPGNAEIAQQEARDATAAGVAVDSAGSEQQQADERWLRRIPDDPGGLLRRKFLYQYSQRGSQPAGSRQPW